MNSRENVLEATQHMNPECVPIIFGTHRSSGITCGTINQMFIKIQIILLLILFLFIESCKKDEQIFNGNVYITNKIEFDEFVKNNFVEINGNLFIDVADEQADNNNISSLSELTSLNRINGSLTISGTLISSLEGLGNISWLNGEIKIISNKALKNLNGIEHVINQAKNIEIKNNHQLEDINSLSTLTSAPGHLSITRCPNISSLSALDNLEKVEGNFILSDLFQINNLDGLSSISAINGNFEIVNNKNLNDISGLSKLTWVGDTLKLSANYKLTTLNGLSGIKRLGGLILEYMSELTDINALSEVNHIEGSLILSWNNKLKNIDGLYGINEIAGTLMLNQNYLLTDIDGLKNLQTVGELYFNVLHATDLDAFQNLIQINGNVTIVCSDINDYCGLVNALKNYSYNFEIRPCFGFHPTLEEILNRECAS